MKEIEILARLLTPPAEALNKLNEVATFEGKYETADFYFVDPLRLDLAPDETGHLSACLRLRIKNNERAFITYKHDHFDDKNVWVFSDEFESEVSDSKNMQEILHRLGYQELVTVKSIKHVFHNEWSEIVVEEVDELGVFLEVEAKYLTDDVDVVMVKAKINAYIIGLGFDTIRDFDGGKPELLLKKKARTS